MTDEVATTEEQRDTRPGKDGIRFRLDFVRKLIQAGKYDGEIKRLTSQQFGVSRKTVIRYLSIVRKEIAAEYSPAERENHKGNFLEFYRGVYSNPKVPTQSRLRAAEDAVELLGLVSQEVQIVQKVDVSLQGSIAKLAAAELTEEDLQKLIAAKQVVEEKRLGQTEDDGEGE